MCIVSRAKIQLGFYTFLTLNTLIQPAWGFQPHIVFVLCDDYGWMDVGFHGSDIATPHIDKLASEGLVLEQHYVLPICTPTRSALLTGMFPIHTGLQVSTISPAKPYGVGVNLTTLPLELASLGYATHGVGKWHMGFCREAYLPIARGFQSFYGFWNGAEHYFTHVRDNDRCPSDFSNGLDYYDGMDPVTDKNGSYSPNDFSARATAIIQNHVLQENYEPLFLFLAFQSVHAPYEVPDEYRNRFPNISDPNRKTYAGMVSAMDDAVANVTETLISTEIFNDTVMILCSDNGGTGPGTNWPLRGRKFGLWEGGIRSLAFVRGWGVPVTGNHSNALIHVVDWFATLIRIGSNSSHAEFASFGTDSLDVWEVLSGENTTSPRTQFVINIEPVGSFNDSFKSGGIRFGKFKYIVNASGGTCDACPMGAIICDDPDIVHCNNTMSETEPILIDLESDPSENYNLYSDPEYKDYALQGEEIMDTYVQTMVPALFNTCKNDKAADPANFDYIWSTGWCEPPYLTNEACGL